MKKTVQRIRNEYPQPLAYAITRVQNSDSDEARVQAALAAFEVTARYVALTVLATWLDAREQGQIEPNPKLEKEIANLMVKAGFGKWVQVLRKLERALPPGGDWIGLKLGVKQETASWLELQQALGKGNARRVTTSQLLGWVVELRNAIAHHKQRADGQLADPLQDALLAWLEQLEELSDRVPVYVSNMSVKRAGTTADVMPLVGTSAPMVQKGRPVPESSKVWEGLVYLWGESGKPLLMSPLGRCHTTRFELLTISEITNGVPRYTASTGGPTEGEDLLEEFRERAPFLLDGVAGGPKPAPAQQPAIDTSLALASYREAVEVTLLDGVLTEPERAFLDGLRATVGLSEDDVAEINQALGAGTAPAEATPATPKTTAPTPNGPAQTKVDDQTRKIWLIAPGEGAVAWPNWIADSVITLGWRGLGDLSRYPTREAVFTKLAEQRAGGPRPTSSAKAVWDFYSAVRPGDIVIAKTGRTRTAGWGIVTSGYRHEKSRGYLPNVRSVIWVSTAPSQVEGRKLALKTLTDVTGNGELVEALTAAGALPAADSQLPTAVLPAEWPAAGREFARQIRERIVPELAATPLHVVPDSEIEKIDHNTDGLKIRVGDRQELAVSFTAKRGDHVRVVVGMYSLNASRDPVFRRTRDDVLAACKGSLGGDWRIKENDSKSALGADANIRVSIADLCTEPILAEVERAALRLGELLAAHLEGASPR